METGEKLLVLREKDNFNSDGGKLLRTSRFVSLIAIVDTNDHFKRQWSMVEKDMFLEGIRYIFLFVEYIHLISLIFSIFSRGLLYDFFKEEIDEVIFLRRKKADGRKIALVPKKRQHISPKGTNAAKNAKKSRHSSPKSNNVNSPSSSQQRAHANKASTSRGKKEASQAPEKTGGGTRPRRSTRRS
jgi:hypothetical protein